MRPHLNVIDPPAVAREECAKLRTRTGRDALGRGSGTHLVVAMGRDMKRGGCDWLRARTWACESLLGLDHGSGFLSEKQPT
eukprot:1518723-Prymnesium_polylepis.2